VGVGGAQAPYPKNYMEIRGRKREKREMKMRGWRKEKGDERSTSNSCICPYPYSDTFA